MRYKRIALVEPKAPGYHVYSRVCLPRLGLPLLGAILKQRGCEVKVYCEDIQPIDYDELFDSDLIGISTTTSTSPRGYQIADKARQRGIATVAGGPHATFLPEEALEHVGYCLRGEAETSFPALLEALEAGSGLEGVAGLSYMSDGEARSNPDAQPVKDLDSLPFPDLSLIHGREKIRIAPVQTSRGCPFNCSFCSVTAMFGRRYRFRSSESVLAELRTLNSGKVFFYDDNFAANTARTKELLELMLRAGVTPNWTAQVRTDVVRDKELLGLMRRSNCFVVYIGLESVNPATLQEYNKSQTVEEIVEAVHRLHEHNILVHGMFVLGAENDDAGVIRDTVSFALRHKVDTVQFMMLTPIPGTAFFRDMEASDRLLTRDWSLYDGQHVVYQPRKMTPYELQRETFRAMKRFYGLIECVKMVFSWDFIVFVVKLSAGLFVGRWQNVRRRFWAWALKGFYRVYGHSMIKRCEAANRGFTERIRQLAQKARELTPRKRGGS